MPDTGPRLKYARVETERRWLLPRAPDLDAAEVLEIVDRYLTGTRLRLREVVSGDGAVARKLGHKVRFGHDATRVACTSIYLDDEEWGRLTALEGPVLRKTRHRMPDGVCVDVFSGALDGLVVAEVDGGDAPAPGLAPWYAAVAEVTLDERYTGAALAAAAGPPAGARQRRDA